MYTVKQLSYSGTRQHNLKLTADVFVQIIFGTANYRMLEVFHKRTGNLCYTLWAVEIPNCK